MLGALAARLREVIISSVTRNLFAAWHQLKLGANVARADHDLHKEGEMCVFLHSEGGMRIRVNPTWQSAHSRCEGEGG